MTATDNDDILFQRHGARGHVVLNRPAVLNAVTQDMLLRLETQLNDWSSDPAVALVTIEGAGDRAFAAGGDIRALYENGRQSGTANFGFYADEYRINALIKRYAKPFVAAIDGVVMGGGVGLSIHGSVRVATPRILFAMPETGIGLFPDVGASYFLPRLPGAIGMYLGLTGARLKADDCCYAGLTDYLVPDAEIGAMLAALDDVEPAADRSAIDQQIAERIQPFGTSPGPAPIAEAQAEIDRCFSADSLGAILAALEQSDWGQEQLAVLRQKSPTSLHLTFRQLQRARELDFEECMRMEYRLARHCMCGHDFYEGVRSVIIEKDNAPQWQPASLAEMGDGDEVMSAFEPLGADELAL